MVTIGEERKVCTGSEKFFKMCESNEVRVCVCGWGAMKGRGEVLLAVTFSDRRTSGVRLLSHIEGCLSIEVEYVSQIINALGKCFPILPLGTKMHFLFFALTLTHLIQPINSSSSL